MAGRQGRRRSDTAHAAHGARHVAPSRGAVTWCKSRGAGHEARAAGVHLAGDAEGVVPRRPAKAKVPEGARERVHTLRVCVRACMCVRARTCYVHVLCACVCVCTGRGRRRSRPAPAAAGTDLIHTHHTTRARAYTHTQHMRGRFRAGARRRCRRRHRSLGRGRGHRSLAGPRSEGLCERPFQSGGTVWAVSEVWAALRWAEGLEPRRQTRCHGARRRGAGLKASRGRGAGLEVEVEVCARRRGARRCAATDYLPPRSACRRRAGASSLSPALGVRRRSLPSCRHRGPLAVAASPDTR